MRSPARRRPVIPRWGDGDGRWLWMGPLVEDAVRGVRVPKKLCVRQRGGLVDNRYSKGSHDKPKEW